MIYSALTIFPEMFKPFRENGIIKRAIDQGHIQIDTVNIRDFTEDKHQMTDDRPYGGGCGMVMKPEPLSRAILAAKKKVPSATTVLLTPQGKCFNQKIASDLAKSKGITLICGRYEGVDERIFEGYIDEELSTGDYVLTGGELAAMIVMDAVTRLIPGVLGNKDSADNDSFSNGLLEHPHYTRPNTFEGNKVPEVLLSGHHREIENWRLKQSLIRTFLKRKDMLIKKDLSAQEIEILKKWCHELKQIIRTQPSPGTGSLSGDQ